MLNERSTLTGEASRLEAQLAAAELAAALTEAGSASEALARVFRACETPAALRKRYRELASTYHPDNPGGNAETFHRIVAAYETRLHALSSQDPLNVEIRQAIVDLGEVLAALAERAVTRAIGRQAYKQAERAARTGWAMIVGLTRNLLGSAA